MVPLGAKQDQLEAWLDFAGALPTQGSGKVV